MKSARERASEAFDVSQVSPADFVLVVAEMFREHARDQRATCAWVARDTAGNAAAHAFARDLAPPLYAEVLNAPAPGEEQ